MRLAPEILRASRIRWQIFATLTFRGQVPSPERRGRLAIAWLVGVARLARVPFHHLIWVSRDETGERFGRHHFHVLIRGVATQVCTFCFLKRIKHRWRKLGFADVRLWGDGLNAVAYSMAEDAANCYESSKFVSTTGLMLSESFHDMVWTGDWGERQCVKQREKPRRIEVMPDNAGKAGESVPVMTSNSQARVWPGSEGLGLEYLVAANASDQGVNLTFCGGHHRRV